MLLVLPSAVELRVEDVLVVADAAEAVGATCQAWHATTATSKDTGSGTAPSHAKLLAALTHGVISLLIALLAQKPLALARAEVAEAEDAAVEDVEPLLVRPVGFTRARALPLTMATSLARVGL